MTVTLFRDAFFPSAIHAKIEMMGRLKPESCFSFGMIVVAAACAHSPSSPLDRSTARAPASKVERTAHAPFAVRVKLLLRCEGETTDRLIESDPVAFLPDASPFEGANGGLVPVLTARLQIIADRVSLDAAVRNCGEAGKVKRLTPKSIRSGSWNAILPLACGQVRCVLSPYDPAVRAGVEFLAPAPPLSAPGKRSAFDEGGEKHWRAHGSCRHVIRASACYGDCMSDHSACSKKGEFVETLLTPSHEVEGGLEICGDSLRARLDAERVPAPLRPIECRLYFLEAALKRSHPALSCAAFRVSVPDCAGF